MKSLTVPTWMIIMYNIQDKNATQLTKKLDLGHETARNIIKTMIDKGLLYKNKPKKRAVTYQLSPKGMDMYNFIKEITSKVEFIKEGQKWEIK